MKKRYLIILLLAFAAAAAARLASVTLTAWIFIVKTLGWIG